ncbi:MULTISPECIES: PH-like domain-containing protein [Brevibacterium]|uniref:Transporter n=2 Tax=Brevibacterium TaxID=1696 RepID=A0ABP9U4D3_9MICO
MDRSVSVLIIAGVVVLIMLALTWGWTRRKSRQTEVAAPAKPHLGITPIADPVEGSYVSTTTAGNPLDRVAIHGLGIRTTGELVVTDGGVIMDLAGREDFLIPRADIVSVDTTSGMIGKFVERGGIVRITWRLGETLVDTGFRARYAADTAPTVNRIREMIVEAP